jgi:hypothetical protein
VAPASVLHLTRQIFWGTLESAGALTYLQGVSKGLQIQGKG